MPTLQDGRNAIDQGNLQQARLIFEALLQENARSTEAWLGLAEVLTETEDKRICYENALKIDKNNQAAREGLRSLEPRANPLVAALAQPTAVKPADEEEELDFMMDEDDEPTMVSTRPADLAAAAESDSGPSTTVLVIVGLALSIVVFAIGGGVVYLLITSLAGG
jgi:hypothetical protein